VDRLPSHVLKSEVLQGNHLGRLGNLEKIPSKNAIEEYKYSPKVQVILNITDGAKQQKELHKYARTAIENNDLQAALSILFCIK